MDEFSWRRDEPPPHRLFRLLHAWFSISRLEKIPELVEASFCSTCHHVFVVFLPSLAEPHRDDDHRVLAVS